MSASDQTLHDFVLDLLTNDDARSAFAADPGSALQTAGLGDVTPQDVQEVVPLVVDYAPGLADLGSLGEGLPMDSLPTDSVIEQLKAVANSVPGGPEFDFDADATDGAHGFFNATSDQFDSRNGFAATTEGVSANSTTTSDFGGVQLAGDGSTDGVHGHAAFVTEQVSGQGAFEATTDGTFAATASSTSDFGGFELAGDGSLDGAHGRAVVETDQFSGHGALEATADGSVAANAGAESMLGTLDTHADGSLQDGFLGGAEFGNDTFAVEGSFTGSTDGVALGGSLHSPLGDYSFDGVGVPSIDNIGDLGNLPDLGDLNPVDGLDTDVLGKGGVAAAGTVADYVSKGGHMLSGGVDTGSDTLAGYLTGTPAAPVGDVVTTGADTVSQQISTGADTVADQVSHLPAQLPNDGLPADLPADLPTDLGGLPVDLGDLPVDLGDLPTQLPDLGGLPTDLPIELPVANPLPDLGSTLEHNPLTDAVSHSPLGELTGGDQAAAHDSHLLPDLHLGH